MATWTLSTAQKKSAIERQIWYKNGVIMHREEGYRWGTFYCESDTKPEIDLSNPGGFELSYDEYDWELDHLSDGCWADWEFPEDMSEEEQERIQALWDEDSYQALEDDGWTLQDTEYEFYGPLILECDGEQFTAEETVVEPLAEHKPASPADTGNRATEPPKAWPFPTRALNPDATWPFPSERPPE